MRLLITIGFEVPAITVEEAIEEALEIEYGIAEQYDNRSVITGARDENETDYIQEVREQRNKFLLKKFSGEW